MVPLVPFLSASQCPSTQRNRANKHQARNAEKLTIETQDHQYENGCCCWLQLPAWRGRHPREFFHGAKDLRTPDDDGDVVEHLNTTTTYGCIWTLHFWSATPTTSNNKTTSRRCQWLLHMYRNQRSQEDSTRAGAVRCCAACSSGNWRSTDD